MIFILGMGRSGTSALARILSLCGCALPAALKEPNEANPSGFWEPLDALRLNDEFLLRHEATYFDPTLRLQGELSLPRAEVERYIAQIGSFLSECPSGPPLVIKDPRITALFDFWLRGARQAGFDAKVIVPVRHPQEVAASLAARVEAPLELWHALWLKYNLLAEVYSRSLPRVFIEYSSLLRDWRLQIARVSRSLEVPLAIDSAAAAVEGFLTRDLHRQKYSGSIPAVFGYPWVADTYTILTEAARDRPLEAGGLDEILRAYRTCERAFRVALDDARRKLPARAPDDGIITWSPESS
ncbi:MAG TPA: sulfotransferase [Steroidobacteraceae bacterium]